MPAAYHIPTTMKGSVPWEWARERLTNSHNYLITTVRPDCRPHTMVVWGIWLDNAYYFSTGSTTRKARNLAVQSRIASYAAKTWWKLVIVEGQARQLAVPGIPAEAFALVSEEVRLEARSRDGAGIQGHAACRLCDAGKAVSGWCDPLAFRVDLL